MLRCCLEDEAVRVFGAPGASCVDGGVGEVAGKEAVERGVPGIEGGRGYVAAVTTGANGAGADVDATGGGEANPWGAEK